MTHIPSTAPMLCMLFVLIFIIVFMYYFTCISFAIRLSGRKSAIKLIDWLIEQPATARRHRPRLRIALRRNYNDIQVSRYTVAIRYVFFLQHDGWIGKLTTTVLLVHAVVQYEYT